MVAPLGLSSARTSRQTSRKVIRVRAMSGASRSAAALLLDQRVQDAADGGDAIEVGSLPSG
jgi:hypothetical protein